ncbi:unnamed protein product, partial [Closterium sp. NIES-53]
CCSWHSVHALAPSYASAAAIDVPGAEDVGAASASAKHRNSIGNGGRGGGGGSGGGGGDRSGGGGGCVSSGRSGGFGGGGGGSGGGVGSVGSESGGGWAGATQRGGSGGGQRQHQQRRSETSSPQQLHEWFSQRGASGGSGSCPLDDAWHAEFGDEAERPRWAELLRSGDAIFDLDYDAILAAMYALSVSAEGDTYLCVPPDLGIEAAALGASESSFPGTEPAEALHTFTLDSGASRCFFRESTTLTPLSAPVPVRLADPTGGSVLAHSSTVLLCLAVLSGSLSGAGSGGAEPGGAESGGNEPSGAESGGAEPGGAEPRGAEPWGAGSARVASRGTLSRRELLSPQELREWFARRWSRAAGAGGTTGGAGATGGVGAGGSAGAGASEGAGVAGTVGAAGAAGVGPAGGAAGSADGFGATGPAGTGAAGAVGAGGAADAGATAGGTGAVRAGSGGAARPRPYFVPLLEKVLGLPPSTGPPPPLACPQPVQSQSQLQPASPLPVPSPCTGPTGGLAVRREHASRPASPARAARTSRRAPRPRPPAVPGTHQMALRPSTAPLRVPLPSPSESSLPVPPDPESDSLRAASPTVTRLLATVVTDPSFESTAASALVAELVDFATRCCLDYATSLVAASESVCPPSIEDPDAPDIPTQRSYAKAIEGPYSSQWQAAMDAEMASWKSTGTYVDEVPPPGANLVNGMWIFRVKRPPGSPPVFKARYVARGFSKLQGVDYFQTFSPTWKMTTLRGSLHEEIWLRRPPGFTGSFPPGTQWSLQRPVYGLRQAPREWHGTLKTTLAALGFAPSTADPSLFLRTNTSLPPFYILVYVDDLVFATADTAGLAHVKSELQKRHTCTDLGELRSYLGLQITRDKAQCTITLTQSHMVQQVLQRFDFMYSSPQATPYSTRHSLSALPSDESVELSGPYLELVGCLITSSLGLVLGGRSPVVLTGHADASWVDDLATQRSSQGYSFSLGSNSVSWRSSRSSSANTAEIFTKARQPCDHQRFCTMLACFACLIGL